MQVFVEVQNESTFSPDRGNGKMHRVGFLSSFELKKVVVMKKGPVSLFWIINFKKKVNVEVH